MTTEAMRVHLFCLVDDRLGAQHKEPLARLSPSAVVTIGVLFALIGVSFQAFERWLRRASACQRLAVWGVRARLQHGVRAASPSAPPPAAG